MSKEDILCLGLVVTGIVLFLYGSNFYSAAVGWSGIFLAVGGIVIYIALEIYEFLGKRGIAQKP